MPGRLVFTNTNIVYGDSGQKRCSHEFDRRERRRPFQLTSRLLGILGACLTRTAKALSFLSAPVIDMTFAAPPSTPLTWLRLPRRRFVLLNTSRTTIR